MRISESTLRQIIQEEIEIAYLTNKLEEGKVSPKILGALGALMIGKGGAHLIDKYHQTKDSVHTMVEPEDKQKEKLRPETKELSDKIDEITGSEKNLRSFLKSIQNNKKFNNARITLQTSLDRGRLDLTKLELTFWSNEIPELKDKILSFSMVSSTKMPTKTPNKANWL